MANQSEDARRRIVASALLKADGYKPAAALVRAQFGARSHRGLAPSGNDDHYLVLRLQQQLETIVTSLASVDLPPGLQKHAYAAVVADGFGGAGAGSVAARVAISTLADLALRYGHWHMRIDPRIASEVAARVVGFYRRIHEAVLQRSRSDAALGGMAAALTGMYSVGPDLFVAHVGHTRCYIFRDGRLVQLTRDQTLRERRAISPHPIPVGQAIEDVPHILTDVVGGSDNDPGVMVEHFRLANDDTVVLCTNGLTDAVDDDAISDVLASRRNQAEQCDLLVDIAVANGTEDNATVVIADYQVADIPTDEADNALDD